MNPLKTIFEFKGNIPSVFGIRLGESYDDVNELLTRAQDRWTGDYETDVLLEDYGVFVDVETDSEYRIKEIDLTYYGDMDEIRTFLKRYFNHTSYKDTEEGWMEEKTWLTY